MSGRINGLMSVDDFMEKFPCESRYEGESDIELVARMAIKTANAMKKLFKILDNIDILDDIYKENDAGFRKDAMALIATRWNIVILHEDNELVVKS